MKNALRFFVVFVCLMAAVGAFAQTQTFPSGIPSGSATNGYGPYDTRSAPNAVDLYKMLCFENGPVGGPDVCLFRDIAGHIVAYDGLGLNQIWSPTETLGAYTAAPALTVVAETDTAFHALAAPLTLTSVAVGGVYTGTITGGAANALVGHYFSTAGFTNAPNNKVYALCTASTATTLTLSGGATVAETVASTASEDIPIRANTVGLPNKVVRVHGVGRYTTGAASLLNAEVMLCQTPGCASGTVVAPAGCAVVTTNQANVLANGQFSIDCTLVSTPTVGSAGTFMAKALVCAQLGAAVTAAQSCFQDQATAASAAVDETKNEWVNIGFKFSSSNAANTAILDTMTVEVMN